MNLKNILLSLTLMVTLSALPLAMASGRPSANGSGAGQAQQLTTSAETLSAQETTDMLFMREEEKLAHDVYVFLYELWSNPVFLNNFIDNNKPKFMHVNKLYKLSEIFSVIN